MSEQKFTLISPAFAHGQPIPSRYTCDGSGDVPQLEWIHPPQGTQSFALIVEDPDAPSGTFTHWVRFNIPAQADRISADRDEGVDGKNDFQADGYSGPCPPPNHGRHRYYFRLYALDTDSLDLPGGSKRSALEAKLQGHVLDEAELMATYERTPG